MKNIVDYGERIICEACYLRRRWNRDNLEIVQELRLCKDHNLHGDIESIIFLPIKPFFLYSFITQTLSSLECQCAPPAGSV